MTHETQIFSWISAYLELAATVLEERRVDALAGAIYPTPFGHDATDYFPNTSRNWAKLGLKAMDRVKA